MASLRAGSSRRVDSQRFGGEYNAELQEWREFWKEQEVPESRHLKHSHLRKRLANVFGIGAGTKALRIALALLLEGLRQTQIELVRNECTRHLLSVALPSLARRV